jgi:CubicO group peptidase (beta-lactamase class C family)
MSIAVERLLAYQIEARHTPGALVHVERGGKLLVRAVAGLLGPGSQEAMHDNALFRLASLTKPVVSLAALMQVEQGLLDLDAPLANYLPALGSLCLMGGIAPRRAPTLRDLLRHTSGLAYETEFREAAQREIALKDDFGARLPYVAADDFLARLATRPLATEPGRAFRYGYSTDVLGQIVAAVDGASLGEVLRRRIFEPLGMTQTGFEVPASEHGRLATAFAADSAWHARVPGYGLRREGRPWMECGGAGLVSTLDDFARFARLIANGGRLGEQRLLSASLFLEMTRNQLPEDVDGPLGFTGAGFGFGLGFAVRLDYGAPAMPCAPGELTWSGISGTALFVHPGEQWFALCFSSNMASRMMARMEFRRAVAGT